MSLIQFVRCALPVALAALIWSADGAEPLAPKPRLTPLAPVQSGADTIPSEERLQRDLDRAARERDEKIQAILRASSGLRPTAAVDLGPGLAQPREDRDKALSDLRKALDDFLGRTHRKENDPLDISGAGRQAHQVAPMTAANHIAVAECLQGLSSEETGTERERRLNEGVAEIAAIGTELPEELRPRAGYLKVWFWAELARMPGETAARVERAKLARAAATDFATGFPTSELVQAVASLVADLPGGPKP
ncbi:MAG: hypothetical protein AAB263_19515 [Planctomycetota bacterium]